MGSIKRGATIKKNDNGTLERVDGSRTYIGSATLPSGEVITKRFRRNGHDEDEIVERWLKWQGKNSDEEVGETEEEEAEMADKKKSCCPFNGNECTYTCPMFSEHNGACTIRLAGTGLYYIANNLMKLDANESIELVAMAVGELKREPVKEAPVETATAEETHVEAGPTEEDGIEKFLDGKTFLNFVNLHGKAVYGQYTKLCNESGMPKTGEKHLLEEVEKRYPELKRRGVRGGSVFEAA